MRLSNLIKMVLVAIVVTFTMALAETNENKTITIIVGHRQSSQGAVSNSGVSEFELNSEIAIEIKKRVKNNKVIIVYRDDNESGYKNLPKKVNDLNPDIAISLHANASLVPTSGHEVLYMRGYIDSAKLAHELNKVIGEAIGNKDRGIKSRYLTDRGGHLLWNVKCPVVLLEPFFINNDDEFNNFMGKKELYINSLVKYIDGIGE